MAMTPGGLNSGTNAIRGGGGFGAYGEYLPYNLPDWAKLPKYINSGIVWAPGTTQADADRLLGGESVPSQITNAFNAKLASSGPSPYTSHVGQNITDIRKAGKVVRGQWIPNEAAPFPQGLPDANRTGISPIPGPTTKIPMGTPLNGLPAYLIAGFGSEDAYNAKIKQDQEAIRMRGPTRVNEGPLPYFSPGGAGGSPLGNPGTGNPTPTRNVASGPVQPTVKANPWFTQPWNPASKQSEQPYWMKGFPSYGRS